MLAFLLLGSASGLLSRAQLGALPALWRIETDVSELEDYLKRPDLVSKAASLVQTDKGPDCECINKNAKVGGPDCECINKAPEAVATARKDVADLDALKKKVENADVKDMPTMLALLKSMYARFQTNIADAQKLEANADATFAKDEKTLSKTEAAAAEKARAASAQRFSATLAVAERGVKELDDGLSTLSSAKGSFLAVREKLLRYCASALIELRAAKKGPDCECINKNAKVGGPDCECINKAPVSFVQVRAEPAPEDQLAKEMTHDLEMNFNKIAPFGKEDTAKELQDHAAKTQDTLVDAVENAEVAEIKRAVFRALTRLRAATIKEFDTIARLETQAIDAYNDAHHYRAENPLTHLHEDEAPVETDKLKSFH